MSAVIQKVQSDKSGLTGACTSLLTGFEATLLTSAALTAEVNALKGSLERSESELGRAKKQLEDKEGATAEVATLKEAVSKAENSAALERAEREKQEARVAEVRQELQALVEKHESLERDSKTRESKLALALQSAKTAKAESQKALQEIEAMKKIAAGAFTDLPRSVSDASAFYRAEEGGSTEKVFWSQYAETEHPVPLSNQLKQLVELHKVAEQAMKGLIVRLWSGEAMPGSYFGLVRRLVDACPWIEVIKRSVCIEGARRALARAKVHWGKLDAEKFLTDAPPPGKEYRTPEMYYKGVLKGARLIAEECPKM
ncbi:hypothetical protein CFC21_086364 [Triticum aestivum]|uniref:Uncharacterized protein n=2 Tax=Triticum aestivum TaxID=4565 RepID=A0A3B6PFU7_WHEAT|nr:hypothetical protein CFC21_086364 [Triticum aestivum]